MSTSGIHELSFSCCSRNRCHLPFHLGPGALSRHYAPAELMVIVSSDWTCVGKRIKSPSEARAFQQFLEQCVLSPSKYACRVIKGLRWKSGSAHPLPWAYLFPVTLQTQKPRLKEAVTCPRGDEWQSVFWVPDQRPAVTQCCLSTPTNELSALCQRLRRAHDYDVK